MTVLPKLLPLLLLASATVLSAHDVQGRFTTDKANYGIGEPIIVTLVVSNNGSSPIWVDFKSPDLPLLCHDFAVEISEARPAELWGAELPEVADAVFGKFPRAGMLRGDSC